MRRIFWIPPGCGESKSPTGGISLKDQLKPLCGFAQSRGFQGNCRTVRCVSRPHLSEPTRRWFSVAGRALRFAFPLCPPGRYPRSLVFGLRSPLSLRGCASQRDRLSAGPPRRAQDWPASPPLPIRLAQAHLATEDPAITKLSGRQKKLPILPPCSPSPS